MAEQPSLLQFPTDFPVKIMGKADDGFAQAVLEVVLRHAPHFHASVPQNRVSSGGNYTPLQCTLRTNSRKQLHPRSRHLPPSDHDK